jgi:PAS domain S-box-containing protein
MAKIKAANQVRRLEKEELAALVAERTRELEQELAERKRAEEELRESEVRYRALFENSLDAALLTVPDGNILAANPTACRLFGRTEEEICALGREALVNTSDPRLEVLLEERARTGKASGELTFIRRDGTSFPGEVSSVLFRDKSGALRTSMIVRDISQRKQAEVERERLLTAIEQAGETIFVTDPEGTIEYVNPAFETVTGYTRAEALGQTPHLLKSGKHDEVFYRNMWRTVSEGRTWQGHILNKRKDGTLYTDEATISPVHDATGRIVNYVAVTRDITEHLRLSEHLRQAQKMEAIGRLAGGVAHDFNNLLTVILGLAELATSEVNPEDPLLARIQGIQSAGTRAADLTRQLLAFARKQVVAPKVLDLNAAIAGLEKMLGRLIGEDVAFVWKPGPDLWAVHIDPSQVDQLLANLVVNARDAMADAGTLTVETANAVLDEAYCKAHAGVTPGEYVRLTISDTGCGMDRETLCRIFEPFFTTKGEGAGTGLGLATVYGIVKQAGGYLEAHSEPGLGTSFQIYLPRWEGQATATAGSGEEARPLRGTETVLMVEDEESILTLGRGILERFGYRVLSARTPGEALLMVEKEGGEIHLLVTDVVMPGMNGRELCERLQAVRPRVRCLFLSGYTADIITQRGVLPEGVNFLQKPYTMKGLAAKVRAVLDG